MNNQIDINQIKPVFVVGYMHSGTSMILNALRKHPDVYSSIGETKLFEFESDIKSKYSNLENNPELERLIIRVAEIITNGYQLRYKQYFQKRGDSNQILLPEDVSEIRARINACREYGVIIRYVFDHLAFRNSKIVWVEKTPTHIFHIERILRSIPEALFIEIVRDPRDILASKKTRQQDVYFTDRYPSEKRKWKKFEKSFDPLWDTLAWKSAIKAGKKAKEEHPSKILTISYENIVNDPEKYLSSICTFIGINYQNGMQNITYRNPANWSNQMEPKHGIENDSVGRWRGVLQDKEAWLCGQIAKREMLDYQYQQIPLQIKNRIFAYLTISGSIFEFFQRLYNRWRLGGAPYLKSVIQNYIKRMIYILNK